MVSDDGTTLTSLGATRSNFYIKAANNTYYGQLAFTNGTNSSYGGISYNNSGQYMQFETSNSEWMRLTSGGNLLIGTTTNSGYKLDVNGTGRFTGAATFSSKISVNNPPSSYANGITVGGTGCGFMMYSSGTGNQSIHQFINASQYNYGVMGAVSGTGAISGDVYGLGYNSGSNAAFTPVLNWTSSGNVGIGTSSPTGAKLDVREDSANPIRWGSTSTQYGFASWDTNVGIIGSVGASTSLAIWTNNAERMRITSGGVLCVGTTSGFTSGLVCSDGGTSYVPFAARVGTTANSTQMFFNNPNGVVGSITTSGSVTTYNVTSDYRLKQDLKDYNGLDLVSSIKTYDYEWKSDNTRMYGVMAHELSEVIPYAVQGEKDGEQMQSVDYSKLTPILIKAVQELNEKLVRNNIN
jgi:hypothetical protein